MSLNRLNPTRKVHPMNTQLRTGQQSPTPCSPKVLPNQGKQTTVGPTLPGRLRTCRLKITSPTLSKRPYNLNSFGPSQVTYFTLSRQHTFLRAPNNRSVPSTRAGRITAIRYTFSYRVRRHRIAHTTYRLRTSPSRPSISQRR